MDESPERILPRSRNRATGCRVTERLSRSVADGQETFHSFWADPLADQIAIYSQLAVSISGLPDFRAFLFSDYASIALAPV